jgi:hypothetical protein
LHLFLAGNLLAVELLLFGFVETKRLYDFRNPGSQGDGSFLGVTDGLKGKENGYPGERGRQGLGNGIGTCVGEGQAGAGREMHLFRND